MNNCFKPCTVIVKRSFNDCKKRSLNHRKRRKFVPHSNNRNWRYLQTLDSKKGYIKTIVERFLKRNVLNGLPTIMKGDRWKRSWTIILNREMWSFNDRFKGSFIDPNTGSFKTIVDRSHKKLFDVYRSTIVKWDRWKRSFTNRTKKSLNDRKKGEAERIN